jgi:WD40 repeat protein
MKRWAIVLVLLCVGVVGVSVLEGVAEPPPAKDTPSNPDEERERQIIERFLTVLEKNPRRGTALDRVYDYHVERGSLEPLLKRYRERTTQDAKDGIEAVTFEQATALITQSAEVWAIAYPPDGESLALAGADKVVKVCDVATGQVKQTLDGHGDVVDGVAFSPDGKTLATASYDGSVKLWDVAAGKERATLSGHKNWVFAVTFSPDGKTLASAGYDKTTRLWNVESGRQLDSFEVHENPVLSVAVAPDGRRLLTGGGDSAICLWELGK